MPPAPASLGAQLLDKAHDRRRGATLLIRPSATVSLQISQVLADLGQIEPDQYFYDPAELHVTVLSLFTGTEQPEPYFAQLPRYRSAIDRFYPPHRASRCALTA